MRGRALLLALALSLGGCATVRTLDAAKPGAPIVYSGTRLDWYSLNGGCCPVERFGAEAPKHPALDLPASAVVDTLLLPFALATVLGVSLGVSGGL
ncbi:YceK/YidQ family lipoprotein [Pseudomonas sp.]|uniref:YceK/YidQ family lipoprotein n=1 Tax=Pseudomonas sp. TaxID=306 RepID=UPI003D0C3433